MEKGKEDVCAVIELKITPQRDSGFQKLADRICKFQQVEACFLMSGAYDLLVFAHGSTLQEVSQFIAADLATIDGGISTSTHFMLKKYKVGGVFLDGCLDERLAVTP